MASSLDDVKALMVAAVVLPVFINIGLKARSFSEGAIVIYPVLFLTFERG
jgi:hypothetical protein